MLIQNSVKKIRTDSDPVKIIRFNYRFEPIQIPVKNIRSDRADSSPVKEIRTNQADSSPVKKIRTDSDPVKIIRFNYRFEPIQIQLKRIRTDSNQVNLIQIRSKPL